MDLTKVWTGLGLLFLVPPLTGLHDMLPKEQPESWGLEIFVVIIHVTLYIFFMVASILGVIFTISVFDNYFMKAAACFSIILILIILSIIDNTVSNSIPAYMKFRRSKSSIINPFLDAFLSPLSASVGYSIQNIISIVTIGFICLSMGILQMFTQRQNTVGGRR